MNLTGRPPYQKGQRTKKKPNVPTKAQRTLWERIRALGCIVCMSHDAEIHHCGTGGGGRKDHDYVIPLCYTHHRGELGIDQRQYGASKLVFDWEGRFGTEADLHRKTLLKLSEEA